MVSLDKYREILQQKAPASDTTTAGSSQDEKDQDPPAGGDSSATPKIPRFEDITEWHPSKGNPVIVVTSQYRHVPESFGEKRATTSSANSRFADRALILRRTIKATESGESVQLELQSPLLQDHFRKLAKGFQHCGVEIEHNPIRIPSPFQLLFFMRNVIREYKHDSEAVMKEVDLLVTFLQANPTLKACEMQFNAATTSRKIVAAYMWTIYQPWTLAVITVRDMVEYWLLATLSRTTAPWEVKGHVLNYDGKNLGLEQKSIKLSEFQEEDVISVDSLAALPIHLVPDEKALRDKIKKRGRIFRDLLKPSHKYYEGPLWQADREQSTIAEWPKLELAERVMVDYTTFLQENAYCRPSFSVAYDINKPIPPPRIREIEHLLYPARVTGFAFGQKRWGYFLIDGLNDIVWDGNSFDMLELEAEKKELVEALVKGHKTKQGAVFDDIVSGKGKGLVFLLSGPPGLGKTLTAEGVADKSKRPLYSITSGELTTNVKDMETAIKRIFSIGVKWDAVVLFDEADVLMSKRKTGALETNAIASVFLRLIEYYEGILFLTTNRRDDFDEAIFNRIHVTLAFNELSPAIRANIWRNLVKSNEAKGNVHSVRWTANLYTALAEFNINGRTIKNLLSTAAMYAASIPEPLAPKHVLRIMKVNLENDKFGVAIEELEREIKGQDKRIGEEVVGNPEGESLRRLRRERYEQSFLAVRDKEKAVDT